MTTRAFWFVFLCTFCVHFGVHFDVHFCGHFFRTWFRLVRVSPCVCPLLAPPAASRLSPRWCVCYVGRRRIVGWDVVVLLPFVGGEGPRLLCSAAARFCGLPGYCPAGISCCPACSVGRSPALSPPFALFCGRRGSLLPCGTVLPCQTFFPPRPAQRGVRVVQIFKILLIPKVINIQLH